MADYEVDAAWSNDISVTRGRIRLSKGIGQPISRLPMEKMGRNLHLW